MEKKSESIEGLNKMNKLILIIFISFCSAQTDWSKFAMGMDFGGFIPDRNGIYGTLYFFDKTKFPEFTVMDTIKIIPFCGVMFYHGTADGSGKYEDYTDIMGTVNIYGDRNDGLISIGDAGGFAGVGRIFIKQQEFIFHYGFASYDKSYFQALYDPFQILGNDGYYYIDSNVSNDKEQGFIYGLKYNYHFPGSMKDFIVGIGLQSNTLSDVPKVLIKMDFGFIIEE